MHHIKTGKLRKHMSAMMAVIMAVSLAVPAGLSFSARTVSAADKTVEAKAGETIYNLRDGSIIATDTDGKKDVTYDRLTVKVGTKNAYKYNGPDHGVAFKDGNSLEIAVDGPSKISLGGCQYSNNGTITASSADGSYTETKDARTAMCYHQDGTTIDFAYTGEAKTTITIAFSCTVYVPEVIVGPYTADTPDDNGVKKDSTYMYNFADGSVVPASYDSVNPLKGSIESKDGNLKITGSGDLYMHDTQHGLALYNGNTFEVKVAGNSTVTFNMCQYGGDAEGKIVASTKKGEFVTDTKQLLMDGAADGLSSMSFRYEGVATTLKFTVSCADKAEMYLHGINVANEPE